MKYNANALLEICFRSIDVVTMAFRAFMEEQNKTIGINQSYAWGYNRGQAEMLHTFRNDLDSGKLSDTRMDQYEKDYELTKAHKTIKTAADRGYLDGYRDTIGFIKMLYRCWDKEPYYISNLGAKFYLDSRMQPEKDFLEGETKIKVLSVNQMVSSKPLLTVDENGEAVAYALPKGLESWANEIMNSFDYAKFPIDCVFTRNGEEYKVTVL